MHNSPLSGYHDANLVALSVVFAIVASYAALEIAARVTASREGARTVWVAAGAFTMGLGIWSMHYVGMLAFHLVIPIAHYTPLVALSLLAAVFASAVALVVASRPRFGIAEAMSGSLVMGGGIAAMHYIGMSAMRLQATLRYDRALVVVSVVVAIAVSFVALWLAFHLRDNARRGMLWRKLAAAVVMGAAIATMHYSAMAAAHFHPSDAPVSFALTVDVSSLGTMAVAFTALAVSALVIVLDRRLDAHIVALETSEEARRTQGMFLRQVIDANPHLVFAKDWDGRFTLANRAVAEVYGTTPALLIGKGDADFNSNADEVAHFLQDDRDVITSGKPRFIGEEQVTNASGETRWFQTIKVPLHFADGAGQVLGVATDITSRKQLEEQLRQSQKMEAVGRLAGGVAHDFNNLLTAIIGNVELLLEGDGTQSEASRRADLVEVRTSAERAAGLTRQLLAFSRKQVLQPKVVDLNALVANMHRLLARLIGEHIELCTVAAPDLGSIEADPGQLEQVIMNLAVNARDAMPDGGRLTIQTAEVEVDGFEPQKRDSMKPGQYVMLEITDTGVGIDEETRSHLFEPFFTTKPVGEGSGLGLAMVYGIVKQSGGYIWVYSEPGKGATFKLYFPRSNATVEETPASKEPPPPRGSQTVLVVEDEKAVRRLVCRVLRAQGYAVLEAADGEEALRVAAEHRGAIDLLLTDVVMPRLGGPELAAQLGARDPELRVLFVSGYTDDAIVQHGVLEAGVKFLQKPFAPDSLARKVHEVLHAA